MSETKIDGKPIEPVPANLPEDLIPLYQWWKEKGRDFLIQTGIVLLAVVISVIIVNYRSEKARVASAVLLTANDVPSLEEANAKFGKSKVGPLIRLNLAGAYLSSGAYDNALETFEGFIKLNKNHKLLTQAKLGSASSLEALKKFDEAIAVYDEIISSSTTHERVLATCGKARCLAATEKKDEAVKILTTLRETVNGSPLANIVEKQISLTERFTGFTNQTGLFDQMNALEGAKAPSDAADISSAEEVVPPAETSAEVEK